MYLGEVVVTSIVWIAALRERKMLLCLQQLLNAKRQHLHSHVGGMSYIRENTIVLRKAIVPTISTENVSGLDEGVTSLYALTTIAREFYISPILGTSNPVLSGGVTDCEKDIANCKEVMEL
nr:hypothetical protein Iba_chr10dCG13020 [Ipomoea batatas]